ncbi:hypothetical protein MTO96_002922 [Rhipicephalus appendiculatus]
MVRQGPAEERERVDGAGMLQARDEERFPGLIPIALAENASRQCAVRRGGWRREGPCLNFTRGHYLARETHRCRPRDRLAGSTAAADRPGLLQPELFVSPRR